MIDRILTFGAVLAALVLLHAALATAGPRPKLGYTRLLGGGAQDQIRDVAMDSAGNVVVAGGSASPDFPVTSGAYDTSLNASGRLVYDAVVAKLDPTGQVLWATYLGGPEYDRAYAVEIGSDGSVYVAGRAGRGFPITAGVVQPEFAGGVRASAYGEQDAFVAKLSADGSQLLWSTYLGTDDGDILRDIDVDDEGFVYGALGRTTSTWPLITPGAFQTTPAGGQDGIILKLSPDATRVIWATYLGGSGNDIGTPSIRVVPGGDVVVLAATVSKDFPTTPGAYDRSFNGGIDHAVTRIRADGAALVYSTYLGGSSGDFSETHGLAVDPTGRAIVAGTTRSTDWPTTPGVVQPAYAGGGGPGRGKGNYGGDGAIAVLSADGKKLLASTYLGGSNGEGIEGVSLLEDGISVSGATYSSDFPVTDDALQPRKRADADFFVAQLDFGLKTLRYSSFLGGAGADFGRSSASSALRLAVGGMSRSEVLVPGSPDRGDPSGDGAVVFMVPAPSALATAVAAGGALLLLRVRRRGC